MFSTRLSIDAPNSAIYLTLLEDLSCALAYDGKKQLTLNIMKTGNTKRSPKVLLLNREAVRNRALLLPNLITSIGIFCGFLAVLSTLDGKFLIATACIGIAFILDGLDGRVARKMNATSEFGKELDSLSDVTAFGVAPAVLTYAWAFKAQGFEIGVPIAFIFLVCGATRLARFNTQTEDSNSKNSFTGLPIPAAAASVASLVYFNPNPLTSLFPTIAIACYSIILSYLMVSSIDYGSPKYLKLSNINPTHVLIVISATVALAWYNSRIVFAVGFLLYTLSGPLFTLINKKEESFLHS